MNLFESPACEVSLNASLKQIQMFNRSALCCIQHFLHQIVSYLPFRMQVMMSPRLFTFQGKINKYQNLHKAYLVLAKIGPVKRPVRPNGDWPNATRKGNVAEHRTEFFLREGK